MNIRKDMYISDTEKDIHYWEMLRSNNRAFGYQGIWILGYSVTFKEYFREPVYKIHAMSYSYGTVFSISFVKFAWVT